MAEYIERGALLKYPIRIDHYDKEHGKLDFVLGIESVLEYAEALPAADVVEVVRCLECKHTREKNEYEKNYLVEDVLICTSPDVSDDCWSAVWPDHFCSYGERKEGDA